MLEKPLIANVLLRILEIGDLAAQKELCSSIFFTGNQKKVVRTAKFHLNFYILFCLSKSWGPEEGARKFWNW